MASLQRVRAGDKFYWRIVESRRVNGKPRPIPILHIGTADRLLERLLQADNRSLRLSSFQHGDIAALKAAADRLDVIATIDRHVEKHVRPLSIGTTILLAALNRAVRPRSKRGWAAWAEGTSISRFFPGLKADQLTSQYFWDQMNCVPVESLVAIEDELTKKLVDDLKIDLDTIFYDATNFFTYIASTNAKPKLAKRGHSKQHRADLKLFSLALLVSREDHIPLCSHVYEGNQVDVSVFPSALTKIRQRLEKLSLSLTDVTIVYDKGNNSIANQALVDGMPFGYVASLTPSHHKDLMDIPLSEYHTIKDGSLADTAVHRLTKTVWGAERTVLLLVSERLRAGQIRGLDQHLRKRLEKLADLKKRLATNPTRRPSESTRKKIDAILTGQHMGKILAVEFDETKRGGDRLSFSVDTEARSSIERDVFGKRILITNRGDWSDEQIILAFRGQSHVEETFRQSKDDEHFAVRPQYHWTDQKIHVHTFICLLALILGRVIQRTARKAGSEEGLSGILDRLARIRLAMVVRSSGKRGGRPRCDWQLEHVDKPLLDLFHQLVPNERPFVYTPQPT